MTDGRKTHSVNGTHWRLLNSLIQTPKYLGQCASEDTLLAAITAKTVQVIGYSRTTGKPLVTATAKGLRCHKAGGWAA